MERRSRIHRLWEGSVWGPLGVAPDDWRYRNLYRVVLPLTDLFFAYFGIVGWAKGVGSVRDAAGGGYATWWAAAIAVAAIAALIGVAFPRLWWLELIAKIVLVGQVLSYVVLYVVRIITDFSASASAGLVLILILLPAWRIGDLGLEWWKHRRGGGR